MEQVGLGDWTGKPVEWNERSPRVTTESELFYLTYSNASDSGKYQYFLCFSSITSMYTSYHTQKRPITRQRLQQLMQYNGYFI